MDVTSSIAASVHPASDGPTCEDRCCDRAKTHRRRPATPAAGGVGPIRTHSRWPTLDHVDRSLDQRFDLDAHLVIQGLPAELLYPPPLSTAPPSGQQLCLTIAGAAACACSQEDATFFIEAVRLAAEMQRDWPCPSEDTDEPRLETADLVSRARLPAAGRNALLTRVGLLLQVEPWGWSSANVGEADWSFVLSRGVRRFRGVKDLGPQLSGLDTLPVPGARMSTFCDTCHSCQVGPRKNRGALPDAHCIKHH